MLVDNGYGDAPAASCEVPIFAGETSALFTVTTIRDYTPGSDVPVQITAENTAYAFGQTIVTVRNIDLPSVSLTADGYTQDFAGFTSAATLPPGWTLTGSVQTYSLWANATSGAKYSSATTNVFGYQHTGSTGIVQQIVTLKNDTGAVINDLTVSYVGRTAIETNGRTPSYAVTVNGVAYPTLAYSTASGDNVSRVAAIFGLSIQPGQTIEIKWSSDGSTAGSPGSGSRRQIGISDLNVAIGAALLPPSIATLAVPLSSIGQSSADASAEVTGDGGSALTARGFVYAPTSVNADPEIGGAGVIDSADASAEVGTYSATLSGLTGATQYSIKAYATNAEGTTYTAVRTFTTLGAPVSFTGAYAEPFDNFTAATSPSLSSGVVKSGWTAISSLETQGYVGAWTSGSSVGGFYGGVSDPGVLGYQHTSSTGTLTVTLRMVNDTGGTLNQLYVRYLGRVQALAGTRLPEWTVTVAGVSAPDLTYSTASGVDETKSALVTGLSVPDGGEFTITWTSDRDNFNTGTSRRIGLASFIASTSAIPDPAISVSGSLTSFSSDQGSPSTAQSFSASGVGLNGNITVTAPTDYEVSLNNTTFASSLVLPQIGGTVSSTPVYVRIAATAPAGNPAGQISLTSSGATAQNIAVTGTVTGGSVYDTWAGDYGLDPATNGAPTADPDGDSFTNEQEYAFGTNPTAGDGSMTAIYVPADDLTVTWFERPDVTYNVQSTADLGATGFANDGTVTVVDGPTDPAPPTGYTRKQFTVPVSGQKFYRVTGTTSP